MKKKILVFTAFLLILAGGLIVSCKEENLKEKTPTNGVIIGYTNCNSAVGLFIITEKKDSLLSFNVPLASIGIDPDSLMSGVYGMKRNAISFDYRIAVGAEIKQMADFLCPQNDMHIGFFCGPLENYTQIIINDIKGTP